MLKNIPKNQLLSLFTLLTAICIFSLIYAIEQINQEQLPGSDMYYSSTS